MMRRNGRLTQAEGTFVAHMAATGDTAYAAAKAGYTQPGREGGRLLDRPLVREEVLRLQMERLVGEGVPAALNCLLEITGNPKAPAGARVQAAKVLMDKAGFGISDAMQGKEPHEMSPGELAEAIAKLEAMAAAKATPIGPGPDVFD